MQIEVMRKEIIKAYPGDSWKEKVKNMSTAQVIAIYHTLLRNRKFEKPIITMPKDIGRSEAYKQLSLFDDMLVGYDTSSGEDYSVIVEARHGPDGVTVTNILCDEEVAK